MGITDRSQSALSLGGFAVFFKWWWSTRGGIIYEFLGSRNDRNHDNTVRTIEPQSKYCNRKDKRKITFKFQKE